MIKVAYKRLATTRRPIVSFILLDWSCRESFHSLDYLSRQDADRDSFEIIWIEYYDLFSTQLERKVVDYAERGLPAPIDVWTILGMDKALYYHKHLMYNIGMAQSRGDLVVICDSDAMFPPNFVDTVIMAFQQNPDSVIHFDEVRNSRQDFYPFNYPSFDDLTGPGAINWRDGKTTGLWDSEDPLHSRNYGACFCARRSDLIAIGGADEHLDYLGHVCGPYELTFRLVNKGLREVWHDRVFLYHTWHPGSDGEFNYIGPSDGRHMSTTALEIRQNGRVMPLLENATVRGLRQGRDSDLAALVDPAYADAWTEEAVSRSPRFKLFEREQAAPRLVMTHSQHNIVGYNGEYYAVPHTLGTLDLTQEDHRSRAGVFKGSSIEAVRSMIEGNQPTGGSNSGADVALEGSSAADLASPRGHPSGTENPNTGAVALAATTPPTTDTALVALGRTAVSSIANDLLKIVAQRQIDRRAQYQRLLRLEQEIDNSRQTLDRLRAAMAKKDQLIAALQQEIVRHERQEAGLTREAGHWREHALRFHTALDLLPLLYRKEFVIDTGSVVSVLANSEPGHFLFGPYLPLQAGWYSLHLVCRASRLQNEDHPVLTVEIADGSHVLTTESLTAANANGHFRIDFNVTSGAGEQGAGVEFRFSHHANANIEITSAELSAALPRAADHSSPARTTGWLSRWMRMLQPAPVGSSPRPMSASRTQQAGEN